MKWICSLIFLLFIALMLSACGNPEPKKTLDSTVCISMDEFEWLKGNWVNITDEFEFYESWAAADDFALSGESYMLIDGDTAFYEVIRLEIKDDSVDYIVSVAGQNNGLGTSFRLVSTEDNTFTFSNSEHDYPQSIIYRYVAPDSLYAYIEGNLDGKYHREDFFMVRK